MNPKRRNESLKFRPTSRVLELFVPFPNRTNGRSKRRPRRLPLKVLLVASGRDQDGFYFENDAETVNVSPGGGCLVFDNQQPGCLLFENDVRKGDHLKLSDPGGSKVLVNVRWCKEDKQGSRRFVGFKVMEPDTEWPRLVSQALQWHRFIAHLSRPTSGKS